MQASGIMSVGENTNRGREAEIVEIQNLKTSSYSLRPMN